MPASGNIIDEGSLSLFLGATNLAILSQQDNTSAAVNSSVVQSAINAAEARVVGTLGQLRCSSGTFFKMPFTVGGVAIKSATGSVAFSLLQTAAHQYAGFLLNRWRAIESVPEDERGEPSVFRVARGWEKDADGELRKIIRWVHGSTDGQFVDLDLNDAAVVGRVYVAVDVPVFGGANVNADGSAVRRIVNPWVWPANWRVPMRGIVE